METVQVVLDKGLLRAADQVARRTRINRSALIREALREHLRRLEVREMEARERRAYQTLPDKNEFRPLQRITAWPED
jgi:metal-responsive CopG/Arc/MetJ family transcriptional regulator